MKIVLGTKNKKKIEEIKSILPECNFADLNNYPPIPDIVEDGATFEENARKKASETAKYIKEWVLAEDSGLVVPALGGRPGIYSARFAGPECNTEKNNDLLLYEMSQLDDRNAYFICVVAISDPKGIIKVVKEGRCYGIITKERRGCNNFGYDPLFLIPSYNKTLAELGPEIKNKISHRARAITAIHDVLST